MLTVVGYYTWESNEKSVSDQDFFVHCGGRYRLVNKERFLTERLQGASELSADLYRGGERPDS